MDNIIGYSTRKNPAISDAPLYIDSDSDSGKPTLDSEKQILDNGKQTLNIRKWALNNEKPALDNRIDRSLDVNI